MEAEMVWAHYSLIWPCQDHHAGYRTVNGGRRRGRQKKRWGVKTTSEKEQDLNMAWLGIEPTTTTSQIPSANHSVTLPNR
ncbi:hypothetical protein ElyMa_004706700 [Elysia marginata]|uniref:Uncharacterized protein n=1 Tax=Elysia marginata TaxID=1093978 RepID=A0AAV4I932_9GAST|nr:hypothetical protein ElyMa_004706700 [Elysia marginata]